MAIEGFDYKGFATSMAEQARSLVPADLKDFEKEYIVKTLDNFTRLAGEALYNDNSLNLNVDQAVFITQVIAEWSFHKSIDLVHSGILPEYWDSIMQKIAFTIFEIAKQAIQKNIPQDQVLQAIEHHVVKVYTQSIEELQQKGIISEEVKKQAESQSNIDAMAQQAQQAQQAQMEAQQNALKEQALEEERKAQEVRRLKEEKRSKQRAEKQQNAIASAMPTAVTNKQLKLMSLALVLRILSQDKVTTLLNKFDQKDSTAISQYMNIANLESQIDSDLISDCLKEIKDFLPVKKKLTKENVVNSLMNLQKVKSREQIEKVIRKERPLIKRFVAKAFDGEYGELPLKVAGIIEEYISESV